MSVRVDRDVCVGAGQCAMTAPEVFDQDEEDGLVVLLRQPRPDEAGRVARAVTLCPARALRDGPGDPAAG